MVLLGRYPHLATAVSVGVDDVAAAFAATEHLITIHARQRLLHISGPLDHQTAMDRRDGFVQAATKHGVSYQFVEGDYSEESGAAAFALLGDAANDIDGLFAANDEMAFGAMTRLLGTGSSSTVTNFDCRFR